MWIRKVKRKNQTFSPRTNIRRTFSISERFAGFSMGMSSLEALVDHEELDEGGIRRASPLHNENPQKTQVSRLLFKALDRKWALVGLHTTRVVAGGFLALTPDRGDRLGNILRGTAAGFLATSEALFSLYNRYGSDGADQAAMQALAPASLGRLSQNSSIKEAAIWYTGMQGVLSYAVAGVAKLLGKEWRQGIALEGVLRTNSYGHQKLWTFFKTHPRLAKIANWLTIAWEISYPLALLPYPWLTRTYSISALIFHAANAHFMGLGRFAWAFASLHPAINTIAAPTADGSRQFSSEFPKSALRMLLLALSSIGISAVLRNLQVRTLPSGWDHKVSTSGNALSFLYRRGTSDHLLVIEAGLGAPTETYQWFFRSLCEESDHSILTYERAGYGASILARRDKTSWSLNDAVNDLRGLVADFAGNQRIILIGHSLGGEIVRRLANQIPSLIDYVVLIDSTNLNEFIDGSLTSSDISNLEEVFKNQRIKTLFGLGALMNPTPPSGNLPLVNRKRAVSAERNHRLWTAALREYRSLVNEVSKYRGDLFEHDIPRMVFAAETTMELESTRALQEQLPNSPKKVLGDSSTHVITVPGRHDTMFTTPEYGITLAQKVLTNLESEGYK
ncbi:alpha/beta fold hydrolase [Yaniella flava]